MASGINKRTVLFDIGADGYIRFHDFALVMTDLGPMVEPFRPVRKAGQDDQAAFDATDMMAMVNEMKPYPLDKDHTLLGDFVHGGNLWPRTGR